MSTAKPERGTFILMDGKTRVRITNVSDRGAIGFTCGPAVCRKFYCCDGDGKNNRPTQWLWKRIL